MRVETTKRENANLITAKTKNTATAYEITDELTKDEMAAIHGGGKAGKQQPYIEVKMNDLIITN